MLNDTDSAGRLRQLTLPALHAATIRRIEKLNFSFWAAEHVKDGDAQHLSLMERQRTKVWVKKAYAMIDDGRPSPSPEHGQRRRPPNSHETAVPRQIGPQPSRWIRDNSSSESPSNAATQVTMLPVGEVCASTPYSP